MELNTTGSVVYVYSTWTSTLCNACSRSTDTPQPTAVYRDDRWLEPEKLDKEQCSWKLEHLYRPPVSPRLRFLAWRKLPRVVFQPCWSSKRWKSRT